MHEKIAEQGINVLKNFDEVNKLILYGSVYRGDYKSSSDIDIACIIDDTLRLFPLDMEGLPIGLRQKVDNTLNMFKENYNIDFHVPIYWNSEFEKGILLSDGRSPPSLLNEVGIIKYLND